MKTCKVEGCNGKHKAKGYCNKHYIQMRDFGEIRRTRFDSNEIIEYEDHAEIVLYNKHCEEIGRTLIDLDDVDKARSYKWGINKGYAQSSKGILLHRLIMNPGDDMVVDHINHDKLDNRKDNLRICSTRQNTMNQDVSKNSTSGITGVTWDKTNGKWMAYIKVNYRQITLGRFTNLDDAIQARMDAEIEYFGEYRNER